jgi:hypothetical protein
MQDRDILKVVPSVLQMELRDFPQHQGAMIVRIRKSQIHARVKGDLPITFPDERISQRRGESPPGGG